MTRGALTLALWFFVGVCGWAAPASALSDDRAARTVIVVNSRDKESVELGKFYATQRGIPEANLLALPMPEAETISWREFIDEIWQPLQDELFKRKWLEGSLSERRDELGRRRAGLTGHRIAYLVTCRGVPLRINEDTTLKDVSSNMRVPEQLGTNRSSVDSELSLLAQANVPVSGFTTNPLFNVRTPASVTAEFVVKVSRLDGPTWEDARALVLSGLEAERRGLIGRYYVDTKGPYAPGDQWLEATRAQLVELGFFGDVHAMPGTFELDDRFDAPVLYFGWYTRNLNGPFLRPGFKFPPGAIALHIDSYSATTLRSTKDYWCGPLIARGVAATFGNVFEPYLALTIRPDLLLSSLATGATLGDAAYFAMPALGWQNVVIGDPLYRPFKVPLSEQVEHLRELPPQLAGHVIARQAALLDKLGLEKDAREAFARGMKEFPSLALALAFARFELVHEHPKEAVAALKFFGALREVNAADWPLVKAGAELVAAHGSARDALRIYQLLVRADAPTRNARYRTLSEARRVADTVGDLKASIEFGRLAAEVAPPQDALRPGK